MGNKRRRIALSCIACRRRKVKCDRSYPACVRCRNGGQAETCDYVPYEGEPSLRTPVSLITEHAAPSETGLSTTDDAEISVEVEVDSGRQARANAVNAAKAVRKPASTTVEEIVKLRKQVADLEARTLHTHHAQAGSLNTEPYKRPTSLFAAEPSGRPMHHVDNVLRGKGFRTLYYGPSNASSTWKQFNELPKFTTDIIEHFPLPESNKDGMKRLKMKRKAVEGPPEPYDSESLLAHVPDRQTTDGLVKQYLDVIETTYRVLHVPSFLKSYELFWDAPPEAETRFLVILLLVMATVYCVPPWSSDTYVGRSSARREVAIKIINACDRWMQVQSEKHATIYTYQIHILLVVARRTNSIKTKREWAGAGRLLRLAMGAGFHREPAMLNNKISVFEQEMRRRLWATILELEIQMCIDRGLPAGISPQGWDCRAPTNVDDNDLIEDIVDRPPSKPLSQFTRTSFLCISQQHAPLRLELLARINAVRPDLRFDDVLRYDTKIRQVIDDLPTWKAEANTSNMSHALTRLLLYEFLLLIHRPFALDTDTHAGHFHSRAASRDAAINTLELTFSSPAPLAFILCCFRNDNLRAALSICHDLCSDANRKNVSLGYDKTQALRLVGQVLDGFREQVLHLGQGLHSNWLLTSAYFLVQAKLHPGQPQDVHAREAADRVWKIHEHIVERQEPNSAGETLGGQIERFFPQAPASSAGIEHQGPEVGRVQEQTLSMLDPFRDGDWGAGLFNLAEVWNLETYAEY